MDVEAGGGAVTRVTLVDHITLAGCGGTATEEALAGPQARLAFAHLVLHRRAPVPVERLAAAVWEDEPPETWRPALRSIVARVRRFVGSATPTATIESGPNGYQLRLPEPITVDVEVARAEALAGEQALAADRLEEAVKHAAQAEQLARGSFLAKASHSWVVQVDDELANLQLRALHVLGETHLRHGDPERAARAAREAIALAPLHEASHRLVMRALAAAGETGEAAQAFDRCRRLLGDELGVSPSKRTTELLAAILREE